MEGVPYCGRQNVRCRLPKSGCPGDLTPENCAPTINRKCIWSPYWISGLNYRTDFKIVRKKREKCSSLEEFFCHSKTKIVLRISYKYSVCVKSRYSIEKQTSVQLNSTGQPTTPTPPPPPQKKDRKSLHQRNGKISVHILEM